jgi:hypothetical protein
MPHDSPATLSHHRKAIRGRCLASSTGWGRRPGFLHRPELLPRLLHYLAQVVRSLVWNRKDKDDLVALRLRRSMLVLHICRVATSGGTKESYYSAPTSKIQSRPIPPPFHSPTRQLCTTRHHRRELSVLTYALDVTTMYRVVRV